MRGFRRRAQGRGSGRPRDDYAVASRFGHGLGEPDPGTVRRTPSTLSSGETDRMVTKMRLPIVSLLGRRWVVRLRT